MNPTPVGRRLADETAVTLTGPRPTQTNPSAPRTFSLPFNFKHEELPLKSGLVSDLLKGLDYTKPAEASPLPNPASITSNFDQLPLSFVPNDGQSDPAVRFQAHGLSGGQLSFTLDEVVLALPGTAPFPPSASQIPASPSHPPTTLRLRFEGANPRPELIGGERQPGIVNYFIGNNPDQWRTNLPTYGKIIYKDLYPGIDLHYNGREGTLKGTYVVAPGADPTLIRWRYADATKVHINEETGDLWITPLNRQGDELSNSPSQLKDLPLEIVERAPVAWQEIEGRRISVKTHYILLDKNDQPIQNLDTKARSEAQNLVIGLALGTYNPNQPLIIDPTLDYSTYLGDDSQDSGLAIAVDSNGNAYVTGFTQSSGFPTTSGSLQPTHIIGGFDAFVTKLTWDGNVLELDYSTFLGGGDWDIGQGIAVDDSGNAYITGLTRSGSGSNGFPLANPLDDTLNCAGGTCQDPFVAKLNSTGNALIYSTYLSGNSGSDAGRGIALDSLNNAYIVGFTQGGIFPVGPLEPNPPGSSDVFVTKIISASGVYTYGFSTYLGGSGDDEGYSIAVDNPDNIYVTGSTGSSNFRTWNEIHDDPGDNKRDAFVTKIISASGVYTYGFSTYLGGSEDDDGNGIAVYDVDNVYIIGSTNSNNFPTYNEIFDDPADSTTDVFITQIIKANNVYTYGYSTYLGGSSADFGNAIAVDNDTAKVYITGRTFSSNFPLANELSGHEQFSGVADMFIARLSGGVVSQTDLGLAQSVSPNPVIAGNLLTYTFSISNNGSLTATGVTLTNNLPVSVTLQTAVTSQGTCDWPNSVICDLGNLSSSAEVTVTIVVAVNPEARGDLTNTASLSASQPSDPNPSNNSVAEMVTVNAQSDLVITQSTSPGSAVAEAPLTYTLTIVNNGPSQATGVVITDTLPAGVTFGSATPNQGTCAEASGKVTCTLGAVGANATTAAAIVVTPTVIGALINTATITAAELDPVTSNNTVTKTTEVIVDEPIAGLTLLSNSPTGLGSLTTLTATLTAGSNVTYTWDFGDNSLLVMTDSIPTVTHTYPATGTYTSIVTASNRVSQITATAIITIRGADIAIRKSGPSEAVPGQPILYNITVQNKGLTPAEAVIVTDTLPLAVSYTPYSSTITPTLNGSLVSWDLGTLAGGDSRSFALIGQVTDTVTAGQTIQNLVEVNSLSVDDDSSNNIQAVTTTVVAPYSHTLSLTPGAITARLGATETVRLRIDNTGPLADVYTISVTGLDPAWYQPVTGSFPLNPGGLATTDLNLRVTDCNPNLTTLPFTVTAHSQEGSLLAEVGATLNLVAEPQQLDLVPANGSTTGSRSVRFSWRTDAPATSTLMLYPTAQPTQTTSYTTPLGTGHTVMVSNLTRNLEYTWVVTSTSACGQAASSPQTFTVGNGVVFAEHEQAYTLNHDYGQYITMTLKNEDLAMTHTLRVTLEHPYEDLIAGFIGAGSIDDGGDYIVLEPGQSQQVVLAVHAQDATQIYYDLTAKVIADEGSADEIVDYALIKLDVRKANDFVMTLVSTDPTTLVKTYEVENLGLPITDLNIQALDPATGLPGRALIQPTLNHAYLATGQTIQFNVIPIFSPADAIAVEVGAGGGLASPLPEGGGIQVQVVSSAGGANQALIGAYNCQPPEELYAVTLHNVRTSYVNGDWYCTNRPDIDLNFVTPGNINIADILGASLSTSFNPAPGWAVLPHNVSLLFNQNAIGALLNQVPRGSYTFDLNPSFLKPAANPVSPVNQTLGLRTQHFNGGHYVINTASRLDLALDSFTQYVCATDPQDAIDKATQATQSNPSQIDIQIKQPVSGADLSLSQPVTLQAEVDDFLPQQTSYAVEAVITYQDILTGGEPYKEYLTLPYLTSSSNKDTYEVTWTPAYTGQVSLTAVVNAITVADSDTITATVEAGPSDLTVAVLNPPDQPAEGETIEIEAEVTNLTGEINETVLVRFDYYRLELTAQEQGGSAQIEGQMVLQTSQEVEAPLHLGPGESQVVTDTYTIPIAGSYRVDVTVDAPPLPQ